MLRTNHQPKLAIKLPRNSVPEGTSTQAFDGLEPNQTLAREHVQWMLCEAAARQVFDTEGAAEYLGVSRQLLELMRVTGSGPRYAKLGRLVRYRRPALDMWLVERERTNTAEGGGR